MDKNHAASATAWRQAKASLGKRQAAPNLEPRRGKLNPAHPRNAKRHTQTKLQSSGWAKLNSSNLAELNTVRLAD